MPSPRRTTLTGFSKHPTGKCTMDDWQRTYDPRDLDYLSAKAMQIRDTEALLDVPAPALAGGIARELTYTRQVNPHKPLIVMASPIKEFMTANETDPNALDWPMTSAPAWKPITHQGLVDAFVRSNVPSVIDKLGPPDTLKKIINKFTNPVFWDVGPGAINIKTAISMLQNYNQMFPDSDPLDLKRYNQRYNLLVHDLKNPDSDTTIKIAGLDAREGQDFYRKTMTPERWAALSEDEQAAALTKYYAVGKERMDDDYLKQGGVARTYTPDFNGDGSDMYLYDPGDGTAPNPARLKEALSPPVQKQDKLEMPPGRRADAGPMKNGRAGVNEAVARLGHSPASAGHAAE